MKLGSTLFLKVVLILIGIVVLTLLVWFPHLEGRARNLSLINVYLDPVIGYIYITFIPFFISLYQAFKLLGYIEQGKVFSEISVKALRNIKYCAFIFAGFIAALMPYIFVFAQDDDSPGVVVMGLILVLASIVIATAAGVFQNLLQKAVDIKSENDLTV